MVASVFYGGCVWWPEKPEETRRPASSSFQRIGQNLTPPLDLILLNDSLPPTEYTHNLQLLPESSRFKFPIFNLKHSRTHLNPNSTINPNFSYVIELQITHMIYQNDQENIIYNIQSSKYINNFKIKKP